MLKQLLSLLTALHLSKATTFNHDVDYNLIYNYGKMGFYPTITTLLINNDKTYCPQNVVISRNGKQVEETINAYNESVSLELMNGGGRAGVNPKCPNFLRIRDEETDVYIAEQIVYYNNKTDTFNVGFFKPLMDNVNITSNAVNDLTIANNFHA